MSRIDQAYERYCEIVADAPAEDTDEITRTESCTRLHLIDPILHDVLGWPRHKTRTEQPTGGGRLDYLVYDHDDVCWFVVEAKRIQHELMSREGRPFGIFRFTGPVLRQETWPIVSDQMTSYLGRYIPEFAALTNGEQWVGFLFRQRPYDLSLNDSSALVFRSYDAVKDHFEAFYSAFAFQSISKRRLFHTLAPNREGFVLCDKPLQVISEPGPLSFQGRAEFYSDLRRAMQVAFKPILDDEDAIAHCFVETAESSRADSRLERMARELQRSLKSAAQYERDVRDQVRAADRARRLSGESLEVPRGRGYLARLIGEPSSGKSIFLKRFFHEKLHSNRDSYVLAWVDVEKHPAPTSERLSALVCDQVERDLFGEEGPDLTAYRELFRREWSGWLRLEGFDAAEATKAPAEQDPHVRAAWSDFLREQNGQRARDPLAYLERLLLFAARNRHRLPVLVVDNVDHTEVAELVMRWAVALHRRAYVMVTVALKDTTLWKLNRQQRDPMMSHDPEQFWLRRPSVRKVLERRCAYLSELIQNAQTPKHRTTTLLGHSGIRWSTDAGDLVRVVNTVLLQDDEVARWLGALCNHDIGAILSMCSNVVLSPHLKSETLLGVQTQTNPSLPRYSILRALIAPADRHYNPSVPSRVMDVFGFWHKAQWAPLLPARVLSLLRAREDDQRNSNEAHPGFVDAAELVGSLEMHLGVSDGIVWAVLEALRGKGLVETYAPDRVGLEPNQEARVKITPSGRLHMDWALGEVTYVRMMAEVSLLARSDVHAELRGLHERFVHCITQGGVGRDVIRQAEADFVGRFVAYVLDEAQRVSPAPNAQVVQAVGVLDRGLRRAWCAVEPGLPAAA